MGFRTSFAIAVALALVVISPSSRSQARLSYTLPNPETPIDAFNKGYRNGQEQRQRNLDYQAQLEYLRGQQRLRALSAEFWASDDARKWQLLPEIAAIDPVIAGQYQASIAPPVEVPRSIVYKCPTPDGSIVFTGIPTEGCTVISANTGQ